MQERRQLLRGSECASSCSRLVAFAFSSSLTTDRRDAFLDHLDELLAAGLDTFDLAFGSREAGAVLHSQPIQLAHVFLAESSKRSRRINLSCSAMRTRSSTSWRLIDETIVASAFLTSAEASQTVAASHDEPAAALSAFRQTREQILRPPCETDVAGACDRSSRGALAGLRLVPELIVHYPQGTEAPWSSNRTADSVAKRACPCPDPSRSAGDSRRGARRTARCSGFRCHASGSRGLCWDSRVPPPGPGEPFGVQLLRDGLRRHASRVVAEDPVRTTSASVGTISRSPVAMPSCVARLTPVGVGEAATGLPAAPRDRAVRVVSCRPGLSGRARSSCPSTRHADA